MTKVIEYYLGELYLVAPAFYCWDIPAVYVGPSSSFLVVVVVLGNWPPRFTTVQLNLNPFSGHFLNKVKKPSIFLLLLLLLVGGGQQLFFSLFYMRKDCRHQRVRNQRHCPPGGL